MVLVCAALLALACVVCGCSPVEAAGDAAATVYDEVIAEDDVTDYIQSYRDHMGLSDADAWAGFLAERSDTPESFRRLTIDELAAKAVVRHWAGEYGLEADEQAVDDALAAMRGSFAAADDGQWEKTLDAYGTNEDDVRGRYRDENLKAQVLEKAVAKKDLADERVASYIRGTLAGTTTKKVRRLLGKDYLTMQRLLDPMQKSDDVRSAYDDAAGSAAGRDDVEAGDLGWDLGQQLPAGLADAIDALEKGGVCDVLYADGTYYEILYCADSFTFGEKGTELKDIPADLLEVVRSEAAAEQWERDCSAWLRAQIDDNIAVSDMPEGLPYDVEQG